MSQQTFLFADLAGFTALTEAHGDEDAADLAGDFCGCVRALLSDYEAEEVKTIGDAIMLRCSDHRQAVELGLRIVEEVGGTPGYPVVRVGMHTGTGTERQGDWFGSAVNLAARVSAAAGGEEVLLTEATCMAAGESLRSSSVATVSTVSRTFEIPSTSSGPCAGVTRSTDARSILFVEWRSTRITPPGHSTTRARPIASAHWSALKRSRRDPIATSAHLRCSEELLDRAGRTASHSGHVAPRS